MPVLCEGTRRVTAASDCTSEHKGNYLAAG